MLHFSFSAPPVRVNFSLTDSSEPHTLSNGGLVKAKNGLIFPIHRCNMFRFSTLLLFTVLVCGVGQAAELPEFTGEWAAGGPYTKVALKGKAVLIILLEMG
jgi:hypothetical protein